MKAPSVIITMAFMALIYVSCKPKQIPGNDTEAEKSAIQNTILSSIGWANNKDLPLH